MKVVDLVDTSSGTCGTPKSEFVCESYDQRKFGKISINRNSPEVNFISVTFQKLGSYCSRNAPYDVSRSGRPDPTRDPTRMLPGQFPAKRRRIRRSVQLHTDAGGRDLSNPGGPATSGAAEGGEPTAAATENAGSGRWVRVGSAGLLMSLGEFSEE